VKTGGREHGERIAAFFDLDGTLVAKPSLEWRFFLKLHRQRAIPLRSYFLWLREALRLAPQGLEMMRHANKMYLRGVRAEDINVTPIRQAHCREQARMSALLERAAWHAEHGHTIVLVSGTVAPLARGAATMLATKLALRGLKGCIEVCATELEQMDGCWTGRILGEAMFGEAKARAIRRLAVTHEFDLASCYAYADSLNDVPMLEAVRWPIVVNGAPALTKIARQRRWTLLCCGEEKDPPQTAQRSQKREREQIWENLG
jgi:HAD superfamily hydrolase (TIGR01490 family)